MVARSQLSCAFSTLHDEVRAPKAGLVTHSVRLKYIHIARRKLSYPVLRHLKTFSRGQPSSHSLHTVPGSLNTMPRSTSYHTTPRSYDTSDDYYSNLPATSPDLRSRTGEPRTWPPTSRRTDPRVSERATRYGLETGFHSL